MFELLCLFEKQSMQSVYGEMFEHACALDKAKMQHNFATYMRFLMVKLFRAQKILPEVGFDEPRRHLFGPETCT